MTAGAVRDEPVGVLGGIGPAATVLFMHRLVERAWKAKQATP